MIDTDSLSKQLRQRSIDVSNRRLLVSRLADSEQEPDLTEPVNCDGLGRIRHFAADTPVPWPPNPLPWLPARRYLGHDAVPDTNARAQVFQNAACNWRCWYCFVPFNLLRADEQRARWVTAEELVDMYLALPQRPPILDLSGGQPDLVPEWAIWMLQALIRRGADLATFLWSDDNLSNDYLFRYLSPGDLSALANHPGYGRVGCLKGFDGASFAFNTAAAPNLFARQLELVRRLNETFPMLYLYITLTAPCLPDDPDGSLTRLLATLADINPALPGRTVPLQVLAFGPTQPRMRKEHRDSLHVQTEMVQRWNSLLHEFADHSPLGQ